MDKLRLAGQIANLEDRVEKLGRMRDLYHDQDNEGAATRTGYRIDEVNIDLSDLRAALDGWDERDGKIRTGAE